MINHFAVKLKNKEDDIENYERELYRIHVLKRPPRKKREDRKTFADEMNQLSNSVQGMGIEAIIREGRVNNIYEALKLTKMLREARERAKGKEDDLEGQETTEDNNEKLNEEINS